MKKTDSGLFPGELVLIEEVGFPLYKSYAVGEVGPYIYEASADGNYDGIYVKDSKGATTWVTKWSTPQSSVKAADEDLHVNSRGGKQSALETRFDLIPPSALQGVAKTMKTGSEKYGERNWRLISTREHLNHALEHVNNYLQFTDPLSELSVKYSTEELTHAATRMLMALEIHLVGEDDVDN